ncbi:unnamed protein product [Gadus morhua 'NCC']
MNRRRGGLYRRAGQGLLQDRRTGAVNLGEDQGFSRRLYTASTGRPHNNRSPRTRPGLMHNRSGATEATSRERSSLQQERGLSGKEPPGWIKGRSDPQWSGKPGDGFKEWSLF